MAHNRLVTNSKTGETKDIDGKGVSEYRVHLTCDECSNTWDAQVSNWKNRKSKNEHGELIDLCKYCVRSGKRNPSHGKDRASIMAIARTFQKVNGMTGRHHSPETRALQSKSKADLISTGKFNIKTNSRGRKAFYVSTKSNTQFHADSILELARMIELDNDGTVISWTKHHGIQIPYEFDGVQRRYVPDFLIEYKSGYMVEEVKGNFMPVDAKKEEQAKIYCEEKCYQYRLITRADIHEQSYKKLLKETKNG